MRAMIRFGKQSRLRFISHLDLQRFFQRAVNRTGLPIAWSQGFNPHPVMSFGSALALGWTSEYEIIDIKLAAPMGRKRTEDALRARLMLTEQSTLKPDLLVKVLADMAGVEVPETRIHRLALLGEGADGVIRPLMEL